MHNGNYSAQMDAVVAFLMRHGLDKDGAEDVGGELVKDLESAGFVIAEESDMKLLQALRNAGVDNWDGYDYAMELMDNE